MASFFKKVALVGMTIVALATIGALWLLTGHGFDPEKFASLQHGMTTNQLTAIMGEPSVAQGSLWIYGRRTKMCRIVIFLGIDDRVADIFHDH